MHNSGETRRGNAEAYFEFEVPSSEGGSDEATQFTMPRYGLLRGAYHRARIRATRWLAMTI